MEKIVIGSDHAGFELKETLKTHLQDRFQIQDVGCFDENSVNYPNIAQDLATNITENSGLKGILICGTGIGMSIAANRFAKVRACLCHDEFTTEMSRQHNDANVLVLGARILESDQAKKMVDLWFSTEFEGGRHQSRLDLIEQSK
ncbi:MAG: ribose 5-phosphate isomerase B [bacterium]|jgi:ribose 5-phosphate isomerase B